jgi:Uma2 family endonuclease
MTVMASRGNAAHPFTVSDLEEMPDDGRRYELIDGALLVSPAPGWAHQQATTALLVPADLVRGLRP